MADQRTDLRLRDDRGGPPPSRTATDGRPTSDGQADGTGTPKPPTPAMPPRRAWLSFLVILVANVILVRVLFPSGDAAVKVPYTLFKDEVGKRNVVRIYSRGASLTGRFRAAVTYPAAPDSTSRVRPRPVTNFATELPAFVDPGLESLLISNGVEISAEPIQQSTWLSLLFSFAPALLIIGLYVWFFRRAAKQGGGLGGAITGGLGRSMVHTSVGKQRTSSHRPLMRPA